MPRLHRLLLCLALSLSVMSCATPSGRVMTTETGEEGVRPGLARIGEKAVCPVTGEVFVVKADSAFVDYRGKRYYFCCDGCSQTFQSNPMKVLAPYEK